MKRTVLHAGLASLLVLGGTVASVYANGDDPVQRPVPAVAAQAGLGLEDASAAAADRAELHALRASRSRQPVGRPSAQPTRAPAPKRVVRRRHAASTPVSRKSFTCTSCSSAAGWAHSALAIRYANCESGDRSGDQSSYNGGYKGIHLSDNSHYRGKWQMGYSEWRGTGGTGDPADASEVEQDYRAWLLWKARGWQPWAASYSCAHR